MSYKDSPEFKHIMAETEELLKRASGSDSRVLRSRVRFGEEVYIPLAIWLADEVEAAKAAGLNANKHMPEMMGTVVSGLSRVLGGFLATIARPDVPDAADKMITLFIAELERRMREEAQLDRVVKKGLNII